METLNKRAIVLSPWLPTRSRPFAGTFVVDFAAAIQPLYSDLLFVHMDDSFRARFPWLVERAAKGLVKRRARKLTLGQGSSLDVPLPVATGSGWYERMVMAQKLGSAVRPFVERARVGDAWPDIHGHVALISGPLALNLPRRSTVFLYEHSSFALDLIEDDRRAAGLYRKAVERAAAVLPVNSQLTRRLHDLFPDQAHKFTEHPNCVDAAKFESQKRVPPLERLIYIGNLKPAKGTRRMLAALGRIVAAHPSVSLTLVGDGPDREWLSNHRLRKHLNILPPVPSARVPSLLLEHDILFHLSEGETFGLTAIEAILSGMPVIVTDTDGSASVVAPIEEIAGRIIAQPAGPESVLAAYEELRGNPTRLDPIAARHHLVEQYDRPALASMIAALAHNAPSNR